MRLAERCQTILDDRTTAMLRGVNDLVLSPLVYEKYPQNPHGWWQYPCLGAAIRGMLHPAGRTVARACSTRPPT